MMAQNCLFTTLRAPRVAPVQLPLFLVPSFAGNTPSTPQSSHQSRSYANHVKLPKTLPKNKRDPIADPNASRKHLKADFPMTTRKSTRDMNRKRGVSAMRSTGPRSRLSVSKWPLPVPENDPKRLATKRNDPQFDPHGTLAKHGLWQFFYPDKQALIEPQQMAEHGREWTYAELSLKSFDDLHALYWIGHRELNRIATNSAERKRIFAGYGAWEDETRSNTIDETMTNIRNVLRDRYESAEEAGRILETTDLVNLDLDKHFDDHTLAGDATSEAELTRHGDGLALEDGPGVSPAQNPPTKLKF